MSSKRILIVEDEERVRLVLQHTLARLGREYETVTAENGSEALEEVRNAAFDLMITDLRMPGMGGVALTKAIRTLSPRTIVVWITAYRSQETDAEAQRLGVYRCLDKPVEVDEIRRIVREALNNGGEGQEMEASS